MGRTRKKGPLRVGEKRKLQDGERKFNASQKESAQTEHGHTQSRKTTNLQSFMKTLYKLQQDQEAIDPDFEIFAALKFKHQCSVKYTCAGYGGMKEAFENNMPIAPQIFPGEFYPDDRPDCDEPQEIGILAGDGDILSESQTISCSKGDIRQEGESFSDSQPTSLRKSARLAQDVNQSSGRTERKEVTVEKRQHTGETGVVGEKEPTPQSCAVRCLFRLLYEIYHDQKPLDPQTDVLLVVKSTGHMDVRYTFGGHGEMIKAFLSGKPLATCGIGEHSENMVDVNSTEQLVTDCPSAADVAIATLETNCLSDMHTGCDSVNNHASEKHDEASENSDVYMYSNSGGKNVDILNPKYVTTEDQVSESQSVQSTEEYLDAENSPDIVHDSCEASSSCPPKTPACLSDKASLDVPFSIEGLDSPAVDSMNHQQTQQPDTNNGSSDPDLSTDNEDILEEDDYRPGENKEKPKKRRIRDRQRHRLDSMKYKNIQTFFKTLYRLQSRQSLADPSFDVLAVFRFRHMSSFRYIYGGNGIMKKQLERSLPVAPEVHCGKFIGDGCPECKELNNSKDKPKKAHKCHYIPPKLSMHQLQEFKMRYQSLNTKLERKFQGRSKNGKWAKSCLEQDWEKKTNPSEADLQWQIRNRLAAQKCRALKNLFKTLYKIYHDHKESDPQTDVMLVIASRCCDNLRYTYGGHGNMLKAFLEQKTLTPDGLGKFSKYVPDKIGNIPDEIGNIPDKIGNIPELHPGCQSMDITSGNVATFERRSRSLNPNDSLVVGANFPDDISVVDADCGSEFKLIHNEEETLISSQRILNDAAHLVRTSSPAPHNNKYIPTPDIGLVRENATTPSIDQSPAAGVLFNNAPLPDPEVLCTIPNVPESNIILGADRHGENKKKPRRSRIIDNRQQFHFDSKKYSTLRTFFKTLYRLQSRQILMDPNFEVLAVFKLSHMSSVKYIYGGHGRMKNQFERSLPIAPPVCCGKFIQDGCPECKEVVDLKDKLQKGPKIHTNHLRFQSSSAGMPQSMLSIQELKMKYQSLLDKQRRKVKERHPPRGKNGKFAKSHHYEQNSNPSAAEVEALIKCRLRTQKCYSLKNLFKTLYKIYHDHKEFDRQTDVMLVIAHTCCDHLRYTYGGHGDLLKDFLEQKLLAPDGLGKFSKYVPDKFGNIPEDEQDGVEANDQIVLSTNHVAVENSREQSDERSRDENSSYSLILDCVDEGISEGDVVNPQVSQFETPTQNLGEHPQIPTEEAEIQHLHTLNQSESANESQSSDDDHSLETLLENVYKVYRAKVAKDPSFEILLVAKSKSRDTNCSEYSYSGHGQLLTAFEGNTRLLPHGQQAPCKYIPDSLHSLQLENSNSQLNQHDKGKKCQIESHAVVRPEASAISEPQRSMEAQIIGSREQNGENQHNAHGFQITNVRTLFEQHKDQQLLGDPVDFLDMVPTNSTSEPLRNEEQQQSDLDMKVDCFTSVFGPPLIVEPLDHDIDRTYDDGDHFRCTETDTIRRYEGDKSHPVFSIYTPPVCVDMFANHSPGDKPVSTNVQNAATSGEYLCDPIKVEHDDVESIEQDIYAHPSQNQCVIINAKPKKNLTSCPEFNHSSYNLLTGGTHQSQSDKPTTIARNTRKHIRQNIGKMSMVQVPKCGLTKEPETVKIVPAKPGIPIIKALPCVECNIVFKTKAEFSKHMFMHKLQSVINKKT